MGASNVPTTSDAGKRKLIAVLYADMVGYSRLIGLDDAGTLERLRALRRDLIDPTIAGHGGRIVQTGGDSLLVAFDSIDGAVRCAVQVQQQMPSHEAAAQPDRAIRFRMGINIGDAIADGTDLHGDAVNVVARLQAECPPGGICVSRAVRDHVHGRLGVTFAERGVLHLKNIARPIEAFVLQPRASATSPVVKPLPEKPSIAVLPFDNLSGDPDQQYFADGLTEDILTALARFNQLTVIARNSTFVYKGRAVAIADVGRDLNVRYVLEGSVRRSGDRLRVTAQLIEAATAAHRWAERYDRTLTDIFALQDEITERIVTTLVSNIERSIIEQARRKPPGSLGAYELLLQGREQRNASSYEGMAAAEALFERAIALDPDFALAHAELAYIQYVLVTWRIDPAQRDAQLAKGFVHARRALALEASLPIANRVLGNLHLRADEHAEAIRWSQRAVVLNPGEAESYAWLANVLSYHTLDAPPRRCSSLNMRDDSTRFILRYGTSISAVRCCTWGVIRKHWSGWKPARGGHRISPLDTRVFTWLPHSRNWAGWTKPVQRCPGHRARKGTRQSAKFSVWALISKASNAIG